MTKLTKAQREAMTKHERVPGQCRSLLDLVRQANRRGVGIEFRGDSGPRAARLSDAGLLESRKVQRELGGVEYWLTEAGRTALQASK